MKGRLKMTVEYFAKSLSSGRYYVVLVDKEGQNRKITDGLLFWNGTLNVLNDLKPVHENEVPASVRSFALSFTN